MQFWRQSGFRFISNSVTQFAKSLYSKVNMSEMTSVREGKADVLTPKSVFYNPVQEFNRDLTINVISEFVSDHYQYYHKKGKKSDKTSTANLSKEVSEIQEKDVQCSDKEPSPNVEDLKPGVPYDDGIKILEALAASGLRSVRFGLEVPGVKEIIVNDFDENAVTFIDKNIQRNRLEKFVKSNCGDAALVMYQNRGYKDRFDVIDLDPYGSASVFLDSAVQAVRDGGLLCITCTDVAVMCGNACETCYAKYGSLGLKAKFCHEMALRMLLQSIESAANRYARYIEPVISISVDFYVRVFVKIYKGQTKVKESVTKLAYVYHCTGCGSFSLQRLANKTPTKGGNYKFTPAIAPTVGQVCSHCNHKYHIGGPIWAEPIHNTEFLDRVLKRVSVHKDDFNTSDRILGMLTMMAEELEEPLYYRVDDLSNVLHCIAPSIIQFRSALMNAGYQASLTHAAKHAHKTDAPGHVVWDIMREWVKEHPVKESRLTAGSSAKAILNKAQTTEVSFETHPKANPVSRQQGMLRWQINPEPDWGPKPRARQGDVAETMTTRAEKGRAKRKEKQRDQSFLKKFPCKKFKSGDCELGDNCCYTHQKMDDIEEQDLTVKE